MKDFEARIKEKYRMATEIHEKTVKVGYWTNPNGSMMKCVFYPDTEATIKGEPDPEALASIEPGWSETNEAKACILFMSHGCIPDPKEHFMYRGYAFCRICGKCLGDSDMLTPDGKYLFPELWWHYIEQHSVKITNESFITDAMQYYNEHKNDPVKTAVCPICNTVFEPGYKQKLGCCYECSVGAYYLQNKPRSIDLQYLKKIAESKNSQELRDLANEYDVKAAEAKNLAEERREQEYERYKWVERINL